jgi:hypothetical protein
MTPEQREKHLKAIKKIEQAPRPEKWRLIKKLVLELKPWLIPVEHEHAEACKELRLKSENKFAASKSGTMRNSMKLFGPVYTALIKADPELQLEMSGKNKGTQELIGKQLWDAFPEYRICRNY